MPVPAPPGAAPRADDAQPRVRLPREIVHSENMLPPCLEFVSFNTFGERTNAGDEIEEESKPMKYKTASARLLAVALLALCSQSWAKTPVEEALDRMAEGEPLANVKKESQKNQTLISECIQYCRPQSADGYWILDTSSRCERGLLYDSYDCSTDVRAKIFIKTKVTNRFGEVSIEDSQCTWSGRDYKIQARCGESSQFSKEAKEEQRRKDPAYYIPKLLN